MDISMVKLLHLWVVTLCVSQAWAWGQEDRDQILEIHNDARNKQKACYMDKMVYDMNLEKQAKSWADKCTYEHEGVDGRGENLAMDGSKTEKNKQLIKTSTQMWYDEIKYYSSDQDYCYYSCHYTQMVWHDTTNIGCYATPCEEYWYLVCFYTPTGNWYGEAPFTQSCESQCKEGQVAEDHLCVDKEASAQEDSSGRNDGQEDNNNNKNNKQKDSNKNSGQEDSSEEDNSGATQQAASSEEDSSEEDNSKKNKQKDSSKKDNGSTDQQAASTEEDSSGEDTGKNNKQDNNGSNQGDSGGDSNQGDSGGDSNQGGGNYNEEEDEPCMDDRQNCLMWAKKGECETNPRWMTKHCKYACKVCTDSCVNESDDCLYWHWAGYCDDPVYGGYVRSNCKYSCELCSDPCVNQNYNCPQWANDDTCQSNSWTANNCKGSCRACESRMKCQDYDQQCASLASQGSCKRDPEYMLDKCRKSCEQC